MESLISQIKQLNLKKDAKQNSFDIIPLLYDYVYSKEIVHSNILADFLNPKAPHDCGNHFLLNFLKLIGVEETAIDLGAQYEIFTEYPIENQRRIDILITWNKYAVIIENKLNNAIDQVNQLKAYYTIHTNEEINGDQKSFNVLKVVYIPVDKNKRAPVSDLEIELANKIVNIYPEDLINWLTNLPESQVAKKACNNYINLLQYINNSNLAIMNAEKIINSQSSENLKELIAIANIINSNNWDVAVLYKLRDKLLSIDRNIRFEIKEKRFAEIFYEGWKFWVSVYFYKSHLSLWIADKSAETEINPVIKELGFEHYSMEKNYHYFKNSYMYSYNFPDDTAFEQLADDIITILKVSK